MFKIFRKWVNHYFADEEAVLLLLLIAVSLFIVISMGDVLMPFIASLILAYLLQGLVGKLTRLGMKEAFAMPVVYLVFVSAFAALFFILLPLIWHQLSNFFGDFPRMLESGQIFLMRLPNKYPELISTVQLESLVDQITRETANFGQNIVSISISSLPVLLAFMLYLILVPILVFFLLKDKKILMARIGSFFPEKKPILDQVWAEMNEQTANYIRGKAVEILAVTVVSIIAFEWLGLKYAILLSVLVGLSVIIPYIGAVLVTIPVLLVGFFQWGAEGAFFWLVFWYGLIQMLDGNVLVPLLFSEAVNLHPIAIILAVLVFGGLWGFWGVFFAIPLATLIAAVMRAWPTEDMQKIAEQNNVDAAL